MYFRAWEEHMMDYGKGMNAGHLTIIEELLGDCCEAG